MNTKVGRIASGILALAHRRYIDTQLASAHLLKVVWTFAFFANTSMCIEFDVISDPQLYFDAN